MAELAYVEAKRADKAKQRDRALELYSSAVVHAYQYLFDGNYPAATNHYDPEFRRACDLYNAALEGTLRIVQSKWEIRPGTTQTIETPNHDCLVWGRSD